MGYTARFRIDDVNSIEAILDLRMSLGDFKKLRENISDLPTREFPIKQLIETIDSLIKRAEQSFEATYEVEK